MDNEFATFLVDIKQIPEPEKPQAVVIATIESGVKKRQGIGIAVNNTRDAAYDPQALIDVATEQAISRVSSFGRATATIQAPAQKRVENEKPIASASATDNKGKFKHKTEPGSISDKQFTMLEKMARERNQSFEDTAQRMFHTKPENLSSEQVQTLIAYFKEKGKKHE